MGKAQPLLGLRERNKLDKRQRIGQAARQLFAGQGFEATTIEQIAREAHVAKGTVFLYAKTKFDLLFLVFEAAIGGAYEQAYDTLPDGAIVDRLTHLFAGFFTFYAQHPALSKIMIKEAVSFAGDQRDAYQALTMQFFARLGEVLQQSIDSGELRVDLDLMLTVQILFGTYAFILLQWLDAPQPDPADAVAQLRCAFQMMVAGFRSAG